MSFSTLTWARRLALGAGSLDLGAGLSLVFAPSLALSLMGVAAPSGDGLVFMRWVGAFAGAVGASYLLAWLRGGNGRLRAVLEFTLTFRLAAGGFSAGAIALGWLPLAWISVPITDQALVVVQVGLLRQGGLGDV